jgi:phosphate butyryltransferase
MLVKAAEFFGHAKKAGVIVGAKAPVALTSRASSAESKLYTIAIARLVARGQA